jgi:hypothetical protein
MMPQTAPQIGPYSSAAALAKLDGRTREAALLRRVRTELTAHCGGNPSATQAALIERCAWLTLHLALMDKRTAEQRDLSERDGRQYLAWSNALSRTLRGLGLRSSGKPPASLEAYLQGHSTEPAA